MSKIRPAVAVLNEIRDGKMLVELGMEISNAVSAVGVHNKAATITLQIKIAPWKGESKLVHPPVIVTAEIKSKLPEAAPEGSVFFVIDDNNISRTGQKDPELGLREVSQAGAEGNKAQG